jgi:hypothetical protein
VFISREDDARLQRLAQAQATLRDDLERVESYGRLHPEAWAGAWFDQNPPIIVVAFTDEVDTHRRRLRRILTHPDRLLVQAAQWTAAEVEAEAREVSERLAGADGVIGAVADVHDGQLRVLVYVRKATPDRVAAIHRAAPSPWVTVLELPPLDLL